MMPGIPELLIISSVFTALRLEKYASGLGDAIKDVGKW